MDIEISLENPAKEVLGNEMIILVLVKDNEKILFNTVN